MLGRGVARTLATTPPGAMVAPEILAALGEADLVVLNVWEHTLMPPAGSVSVSALERLAPRLHDLGYLSGFYSSLGSGVADQIARQEQTVEEIQERAPVAAKCRNADHHLMTIVTLCHQLHIDHWPIGQIEVSAFLVEAQRRAVVDHL